jgi:hypothetical protein
VTLFIAQTDGTTAFDLTQVEVDLLSITLVDTGLGFTENPTTSIEAVTTVPVTYTRTENGPTPTRIDDLVNNHGFTAPPHIVVFGVNDTVVLSDGTPLKGNGISIPVGSPGNPFTGHVAALYDVTLCGGAGEWVDKEGGGTTQNTTEVVLYHELSHCFHFVTGTTAATSAAEEVAAETDENDMRDVRGLPHRDVHSHNGGCGGGTPSCCIVASLATGSPYSAEVGTFRHYREHVLRGSDVGDDFFATLHHQYYAFSPEVVRLMGRRPELGSTIRGRYVLPLLAAVELLIHYADERGSRLTWLLREQRARAGCADAFAPDALATLHSGLTLARAFAAQEPGSKTPALPGATSAGPPDQLDELAALVDARAVRHGVLAWALLETVQLWTDAQLALQRGAGERQVGETFSTAIADWLGRMPISDLWAEFSRLKAKAELEYLDQFMFDVRARTLFARRLAQAVPRHATTATAWAVAGPGGHHD